MGAFAAIGVLWFVMSLRVPAFFLPSPGETISTFFLAWIDPTFLLDAFWSTSRVLMSFAASAAVGVPLGVAIACYPKWQAIFEPIVFFSRYLPVAGFVPISILWFGIGEVQKIFVLFLGMIFMLIPMVADAVESVPEAFVDAAYTMQFTNRDVITFVVLPAAMPGIWNSLRVSFGIGWTYIIVAEIVAAESGLGHMMVEAQRYLQTQRIFVGLVATGLLGLFTDAAFKFLGARLFPWLEGESRHI